jgi:hypothetical protein
MTIYSPTQPTDRDPIVTSLWTHMTPIPRLFKRTTTYVCTSTNPNHALRDEIILQAYDTRANLLSWSQEFHTFYQRYQSQIVEFKLHELLGVALAMQILLQRIIIALQPMDQGSALLEQETQGIAQRLIGLQNEAGLVQHPRTHILLAQKVFIARATVASREDWGNGLEWTGRGVVSKEIFERWCGFLGRKID